ncbi:hypothetical protein HFQ13_10690 [Acidithiobacillus sp. VAN18-1]|uniref:Uncharacterized protein n=1 Tax=Igneacidithiobacillus copahuensis TaxID=2724909 RepID=A0AAE3CKA4_9PROT|nr:hypothetical protein [Igneacidithiobacillus copahuensis]MBU2788658.1 hypothetical protein [Igneacidithiobacillus copahuensis]MBU2796658.1 hypothetical protein [Acidithiobacillus sp. VAN18-2]
MSKSKTDMLLKVSRLVEDTEENRQVLGMLFLGYLCLNYEMCDHQHDHESFLASKINDALEFLEIEREADIISKRLFGIEIYHEEFKQWLLSLQETVSQPE